MFGTIVAKLVGSRCTIKPKLGHCLSTENVLFVEQLSKWRIVGKSMLEASDTSEAQSVNCLIYDNLLELDDVTYDRNELA